MAKTPFDADRSQGTIALDPATVVIITDPRHPRYDPRVELPIDEAYLLSLATQGQLMPGIVTKDDEGRPELVDGRRRCRALRILNERRKTGDPAHMFKALYVRVSDDAEASAIRHAANLHVQNCPSMKAGEAADFMKRFGWSRDRVAPLFGWSMRDLDRHLALLELAAPVRAAVDVGRLPIAAAAKLSELPRSKQVEAMESVMTAKARPAARKADKRPGLSRAQIRKAIAAQGNDVPDGLGVAGFLLGLRVAIGDVEPSVAARTVPGVARLLGLVEGSP